jgi:hypothetical protein
MFEIGQKVMCVKSHSKGVVKEGEIYTVSDFKVDCCKNFVLDVGIRIRKHPADELVYCINCKHLMYDDGIWWIGYRLFKPLDDLYNEEIEELMQEVYEKQPFEL